MSTLLSRYRYAFSIAVVDRMLTGSGASSILAVYLAKSEAPAFHASIAGADSGSMCGLQYEQHERERRGASYNDNAKSWLR
jgi:hypothetical protein